MAELPAADSLQNLVTGLGTKNDKAARSTFWHLPLDRQQLTSAYRGDWLARKGVVLPVQDALREWRTWTGDSKAVRAINETERRLDVRRKLFDAFVLGRLYGGGAIVLGTGDADPSLPLDSIPRDGLLFLNVTDHDHISAGDIVVDPTSPLYGQPEMFQVAAGTGAAEQIFVHASRVVRIVPLPNPDLDAGISQRWGDSVLDALADAVKNVATVTQSLAVLCHELNVDVVKIPRFLQSLGDPEYREKIVERFRLATVGKSVTNTLLLDAEDEWERLSANLSGVPDVIKAYLLIACGAFDVPATRMLGQSPAGLSSTGESDLRNYYDAVASEQTNFLRPAIRRLDEAIVASALGRDWPDDIDYVWNPLWQLMPEQAAQVRKTNAEAFKLDADTALISDDILVRSRLDQLEADEDGWPNVKALREEFGEDPAEGEDVPEPPPGVPPVPPNAG